MNSRRNWLVRLRPRADTLLTSQGRTVLATATTGFIPAHSYYGLFANETRLLCSYACRIDGHEPLPIALSNVEQHSWLGYYIVLPPGFQDARPDRGSGEVPQASQNSLELRLSRYVGQGVREDVDLANFTQQRTAFQLEFRLDADFASIEEIPSAEGTEQPRLQHGKKNVVWRPDNAGAPELQFTYAASHHFENESEHGHAEFSCGLRVRLAQSDTSPDYRIKDALTSMLPGK